MPIIKTATAIPAGTIHFQGIFFERRGAERRADRFVLAGFGKSGAESSSSANSNSSCGTVMIPPQALHLTRFPGAALTEYFLSQSGHVTEVAIVSPDDLSAHDRRRNAKSEFDSARA
jgi:hypothetical protein